MATDSSVAITAGSGTPVDTITNVDGHHQQVVRTVWATAATRDDWTIATAARGTPITADISRVAVHMYNDSDTATVYISVTGTNPTTTAYDFPIPPKAYFDMPPALTRLNIRMIGSTATGTLRTILGTHA